MLDFKLDDLDLSISELDNIFDLPDKPDSSTKITNRYIKPKIHNSVKKVKYDNAKKMAKEIHKNVFNGNRIFGVVSGNFIFGDLLEALFVVSNQYAEEITISTLSLSQENIDSLANLINGGYVKSLNLIISDYFFAHNRSSIAYIYEKLDTKDTFQLSVASLHTKIILIKTSTQKIVIHGSANLRSSRSIESFDIETNADLYDFNYEWHKKLIDKYATINKSIRSTEAFKIIGDK